MYLYVTKIYILSSIFVASVPRRKAAQMLEGHVTNYSSGFRSEERRVGKEC